MNRIRLWLFVGLVLLCVGALSMVAAAQCVDDTYTIYLSDGPRVVLDVRSNDRATGWFATGGEGIVSFTQPAHGHVDAERWWALVYGPQYCERLVFTLEPGFLGTTSFTYTALDTVWLDHVSTATVTVTILPTVPSGRPPKPVY